MEMERKFWEIENFNTVNLPEVIGTCTAEELKFRGIRVLDMPIYMPDQGWSIPKPLQQFKRLIDMVYENEKKYRDTESHYVYITVDQKSVAAGKTGRRPGAHSDSYIVTPKNGEQVSHTMCVRMFYQQNFFVFLSH